MLDRRNPLNKDTFPSLVFLFLGGLFSSISIFITQIILARELSVDGFGNLMSAIAFITLMSPLALFGVSQVWLKIYGSEGKKGDRWLKTSFKLIFFSLSLTTLFLIFWAIFGPHSQSYRLFLLSLLPILLSHIFIELVNTRFQLEGKFLSLAIWQNLIHFLRFFFIAFFYFFISRSIEGTDVVFGYLFISLAISLLGFYFLSKMIKGNLILDIPSLNETREGIITSSRGLKPPSLKEIFLQSSPFGLAGLFYLIYFQSDLIFLKYLAGEQAAGIYAAAFVVLMTIYYIPGVIYQKYLLPKIHAWANFDKETLLIVFQAGNGLMLSLGLVLSLLIYFFSPLFIPLFFGDDYVESIKALQILAVCIPIRFLATSIESPLFTLNFMKWKTSIMGLVAFLNIALNYLLIPSFSYTGAAIATVISELTLLILYLIVINLKIFGKETWKGWFVGFQKSFWPSS